MVYGNQFRSVEQTKLRSSADLLMPYDTFKPFYQTTSGAIAETVVTVSSFMSEANRITLVADKADLYVNFNGDATVMARLCCFQRVLGTPKILYVLLEKFRLFVLEVRMEDLLGLFGELVKANFDRELRNAIRNWI